MNLSMRWLKEFVEIDVTPREYSEAMTMSGSKVEGYEVEGDILKNIVVGQIINIEKHPDADKLSVCSVNIGKDEPIQIVTAATNMQINDKVPVALDNSILINGTKIKKGKLRGVESFGMFCSVAELGLTVNDFPYAIEDGLFIIKEECNCGDDIREVTRFNDTKVEFEITSNRPDCFSVIGLARETAATFNKPLNLHTPVVKGGNGDSTGMIDVKIEATDLCKMYSCAIVQNVNVKPSPLWLRERLRAMGVRPINNIVDITNYVMLEYGQPMHAFDLRFIEDKKIIVRTANDGEILTTLDGVEHKLSSNNLVIADSKKATAIAGVMGGEYSSIVSDTTTIVFESANFLGSSVRKTAKEHGMRTDSSSRFEKGLDPNNCIPALNRALELVELLEAGEVLDGIISDKSYENENVTINFDSNWINNFLGSNIDEKTMIEILETIECKVENNIITVPTFRPDLEHKADISEEIARFFGYNNITSSQVKGSAQGKYSNRQKFDKLASDTMLSMGLNEIMTYSFISPKDYNKILMPENDVLRNSVVISNPLGEDTSIMRTTAIPSMLDILAKNYNNRNSSSFLFELAKEYIPTTANELPIENNKIIAGFYGNNVDFFEVKGIMENLLTTLGVTEYDITALKTNATYHSGRCAILSINGETLGIIGQIHPNCVKNYGINCEVYAFNLDMDLIYKVSNREKLYKPLPKYPATTRDLAIICDEETPVIELSKCIESSCGKHLESLKLFDVYKGSQIEKGKKSVAFKIVLRSSESTLTDEQADKDINKIIKALSTINAILRS